MKIKLITVLTIFYGSFLSCSRNYTSIDVSREYCVCASLSLTSKEKCVSIWLDKFKFELNSEEDLRALSYNMIECNGFEGESDFNSLINQ